MKKLILTLSLFALVLTVSAQAFFNGEFSKEKKYILLVNPTAGNIGVVKFLTDKGILDINPDKVEFVGIYHSSQEYDFNKAADYIKKNRLGSFHLHEVKGELTEQSVYGENGCSDDFRKIFRNSAGVIFFGGQDIPPALYNEENSYSETTDPGRHYLEVSMLFHMLGGARNPSFTPLLEARPDYMVTGFCLGMQSMNVAAGGTMYQDIPAQLYNSTTPEATVRIDRRNLHRNYWQLISKGNGFMGSNIHPIKFTDSKFFGSTVKIPRDTRPLIYSSHHQALKDVAPVFVVTALSDDGRVVEAIAHKSYRNVFAVQFHPEVSALYEDQDKVRFAPDDQPATLHSVLDEESLEFHLQYWNHISEVIRSLTH